MPDPILLRVSKGCLLPADQEAEEALRSRHYKVGDVLTADLKKERNPGFHRLSHVFGKYLVENIESDPPFSILTPHQALKRIQRESQANCEVIPILVEGQKVSYVIPKSLSYASMGQVEFYQTYKAMCDYVIMAYATDLSSEKLQEMIGLMPD